MKAPKTKPSADEFRDQIRERGLRATAPRVAVLQALARMDGPATHGDLAAALGGEGWDRATIYRNLMDLTDAGFARRIDMGDHLWRFELTTPGTEGEAAHRDAEHPHFLCDTCGDVACLPADAVKLNVSQRAPRALRRKDLQIQVRGRCDRCA